MWAAQAPHTTLWLEHLCSKCTKFTGSGLCDPLGALATGCSTPGTLPSGSALVSVRRHDHSAGLCYA